MIFNVGRLQKKQLIRVVEVIWAVKYPCAIIYSLEGSNV